MSLKGVSLNLEIKEFGFEAMKLTDWLQVV